MVNATKTLLLKLCGGPYDGQIRHVFRDCLDVGEVFVWAPCWDEEGRYSYETVEAWHPSELVLTAVYNPRVAQKVNL